MYATIIAAMIAATPAILSPIITQLIAQRGAYKLKTIELFLRQKKKHIVITWPLPPNSLQCLGMKISAS